MGDIDRIREGLFLGSKPSNSDVDLLREHGVSHILTLTNEPLVLNTEAEFTTKYVECLDMMDTDLLSYFEECFEFIEKALSEPNQGVLVHCLAGMSRSATIVIAYLMYKEKLSLEDAVAAVKKERPCIRPNKGFRQQLRLFEKMGSVIDKDNSLYRRYQLKIMAARVQSGDTEAVSNLRQVPSKPQDLSEGYYKCAKCRRILFKKSSVLPHTVGKGQEAFGWQNKHTNQNIPSSLIEESTFVEQCDRSLFIEPVQWMSKVITDIEGKLTCPNCSAKLGSFVWYGEKCPCGTWVAPSFHIQCNKVDLVTPRPPLVVSRPGISQISNQQSQFHISQPGIPQSSNSQPSMQQGFSSQSVIQQSFSSQPGIPQVSSSNQPVVQESCSNQPGLTLDSSSSQPVVQESCSSQPGLTQDSSSSQSVIQQSCSNQPGLTQGSSSSQSGIKHSSSSQPSIPGGFTRQMKSGDNLQTAVDGLQLDMEQLEVTKSKLTL